MEIKIVRDDCKRNDEIKKVIASAFNQDYEARLVESIKKNSDFYISYIAIDKRLDKVVGHVMISPMLLNGVKDILSLAPVSVLAEYENNGIGSLLITYAIKQARKNKDFKLITVLGSDHYYKRFGFEGYDSKRFNLPFEVEARFFQIMLLNDEKVTNFEGNFDYPSYFDV